MGNAETLRGRLVSASILLIATALALAVMGIATQRAQAVGGYVHGGTLCGSCHTGSPSKDNASSAKCSTCHTGYALPKATTTCWACHNPGQDMAAVKTGAPATCTQTCHLADTSAAVPGSGHNPHPARGTCTTCHSVTTSATAANGSPHHTAAHAPPPTPDPTTLTAKVSPTTVKLGKKVKVSGTALPVPALANAKIGFKVERKVGTKWVKMKATATATVGATGTYSWSYKAVKTGSHRVTLSIEAPATYTAIAKLVKTFKVK
jgi:hypothetical protein